jgi:hypothetical protein
MKRFSKAQALLATAVGVVLLAGGLATASNMGFKFVPNIGSSQFFNLGLPWNNNYTNAQSLLADFGGNAESVTRYNSNGSLTAWFSGASATNNYPIVKGSAYIIKATAAGSTNAVIVGSHDPSFTFSFSAGLFNNVAPPYHQTLTTANALLNDMNTQMGAGAIESVTRYNTNGSLTAWFSGASASNNFNLALGMGVIAKGGSGGTGYAWPHY